MLPSADTAGLRRIASQIITGVGFLCGGVIMPGGVNIKGLNTAATLWYSVTVGVFSGIGFFIPAGLLTICIILVNLLMLPVVYFINRTTTPDEMETSAIKRGQ